MREIKFRAWDKDIQTFVPIMDFTKNIKEAIYRKLGKEVVSSNDGVENLAILLNSNVDIIQYTGLKDKNGKEIYEGDILLYLTKTKTVVSYKNGAFVRSYRNSNMYLLYDSLAVDGCLEDYEVIGNIYENPELLEEEEQWVRLLKPS